MKPKRSRTTLWKDWGIVDTGCATMQPLRSAVQMTSTRATGSEESPRAPQDDEQEEGGAPRTYRRMCRVGETRESGWYK